MVFVGPGSLFVIFFIGIGAFLMIVSIIRAARRSKGQRRSIRCHNRKLYGVAGPSEDGWLCANPDCFTKNPGHARYCRMCARPGPRCDPFN
ncbi:MAG: hypothetical protein MI923_09915 [Phycisphaerales bacterium]|nr:hypothetical protein [Phycisphaerales bacterium]